MHYIAVSLLTEHTIIFVALRIDHDVIVIRSAIKSAPNGFSCRLQSGGYLRNFFAN